MHDVDKPVFLFCSPVVYCLVPKCLERSGNQHRPRVGKAIHIFIFIVKFSFKALQILKKPGEFIRAGFKKIHG